MTACVRERARVRLVRARYRIVIWIKVCALRRVNNKHQSALHDSRAAFRINPLSANDHNEINVPRKHIDNEVSALSGFSECVRFLFARRSMCVCVQDVCRMC